MFLLSRFNLVKISVKGTYFSKIAGFFPATLTKINIVTVVFQGFYLDLNFLFRKF